MAVCPVSPEQVGGYLRSLWNPRDVPLHPGRKGLRVVPATRCRGHFGPHPLVLAYFLRRRPLAGADFAREVCEVDRLSRLRVPETVRTTQAPLTGAARPEQGSRAGPAPGQVPGPRSRMRIHRVSSFPRNPASLEKNPRAEINKGARTAPCSKQPE